MFRETAHQILITVHKNEETEIGSVSSSPELLGYIRFNKKAGNLEITNFKAQLRRKFLSMGRTSKRDLEVLAGIHGEGFKLAALVMRRNEYSVRYTASSFYWNFGFRGTYRDHLYCQLSPAKMELVEKRRKDYATKAARPNFNRGPFANIWEDVRLVVGKGRGPYGNKISEDDFRIWLKTTLDLDQPSEIVQTADGDLILDEEFSSRIYLKGLLIPGHNSSHGREYVFGYNFIRGDINRDRERLASEAEEAEMLANIWGKAMIAKGDSIIDRYVRLFLESEDCTDIALANKNLSLSTTRIMWTRLRTSSPDVFFYCNREHSHPDHDDQVRYTIGMYINSEADLHNLRPV